MTIINVYQLKICLIYVSEVCNTLLIRPPTAEISVPKTVTISLNSKNPIFPEDVQTCLKTPRIIA